MIPIGGKGEAWTNLKGAASTLLGRNEPPPQKRREAAMNTARIEVGAPGAGGGGRAGEFNAGNIEVAQHENSYNVPQQREDYSNKKSSREVSRTRPDDNYSGSLTHGDEFNGDIHNSIVGRHNNRVTAQVPAASPRHSSIAVQGPPTTPSRQMFVAAQEIQTPPARNPVVAVPEAQTTTRREAELTVRVNAARAKLAAKKEKERLDQMKVVETEVELLSRREAELTDRLTTARAKLAMKKEKERVAALEDELKRMEAELDEWDPSWRSV